MNLQPRTSPPAKPASSLRAARPSWVRFTTKDVFFQIAIATNLFAICVRTQHGPVLHIFRPDHFPQWVSLWDHLSYDQTNDNLVRYGNQPRAKLPPLDKAALAILRNTIGIPVSPIDNPNIPESAAYKAFFSKPKSPKRTLH